MTAGTTATYTVVPQRAADWDGYEEVEWDWLDGGTGLTKTITFTEGEAGKTVQLNALYKYHVNGHPTTGYPYITITITPSVNPIPINCHEGTQWNENTKTCDSVCPANQHWNPTTKQCADATVCAAGQQWNPTKQQCEAIPPRCGTGTQWNPNTNMCEPTTCPPGQQYNWLTKTCEATPTCPTGQQYNWTTKTCEDKGGNDTVCPSGYYLENGACVSIADNTPLPQYPGGGNYGNAGNTTEMKDGKGYIDAATNHDNPAMSVGFLVVAAVLYYMTQKR